MLSKIWVGLGVAAVFFAIWFGRLPEVCTALVSGAGDGVQFILKIGGLLCFWSGIMEVMQESGLSALLAKGMTPFFRFLFPIGAGDKETMEAISTNITANILGLGNAATPPGMVAAERLARQSAGTGKEPIASHELCLFVLINAASVQLIPTTVCSIRAALGARDPFDILPAVWITTAVSFVLCVAVAKLLSAGQGRKV